MLKVYDTCLISLLGGTTRKKNQTKSGHQKKDGKEWLPS